MDIQETLVNVLDSIKSRQIGHARHLLRDVRMVSANRFVQGLATNAINELNHGSFEMAINDAETTKLVDARDNFSVVM